MLKKLKLLLATVAILALSFPVISSAARTDSLWDYPNGTTYMKPNGSAAGLDILIFGSNRYLNFGALSGTSGYGIRDNAGVMEFKNSGGVWAGLGSGSGGGGSGGGTFSTTTSQTAGIFINYSNNNTDIVAVGGTSTSTAPFYFDPNALFAKIGGQMLVTGSTTLQNFTFVNATGTQATTTNFYTTNFGINSEYFNDLTGNGLSLSAGALNATLGTTIAPNELVGQPFTANFPLVVNTAGTGFVATTGPLYMDFVAANSTSTSATSTNFFATNASTTNLFGTSINGFGLTSCTSTNALTWTGGSFTCTAQPQGTVTAIGVTTANGVSGSSSGGATPNLTITLGAIVPSSVVSTGLGHFGNLWSDASSTLQNFTGLNSTTTNATTTSLSTTTICLTGDTCRTTWPSGGSSASSTLLTDNNGFSGLNTFTDLKLVTRSTTTNATTTNFFATTASTSALFGANLLTCNGASSALTYTATTGLFGCNTISAGSSASSTLLTDNNGFTGLNTFSDLKLVTRSTTTNATTTGAHSIGSASTTNLRIDTAKSALLLTNSSGDVSVYGGASGCAANNFVTTISALGATTCGSSTISGVALGGTLGALTATNSTLTFSGSYDGSTARTVGLNLATGNVWIAASTTFSGGVTITNATTTNATTTSLAVTSTLSKLLLTDGNGVVSGYAAQACTNQFVRGLSALGVPTCNTVGAADVSLANLSATDSTLTFSGTYTGATARTIGINLGQGNIWTSASSTFVGGVTLGTSTTTSATTTNFYTTNFNAINSSTTQATSTQFNLIGTNAGGLNSIYSNAANQIDFNTNGVWRGGFDSVGRFAVGTNTPTWTFNVASTSPVFELDDTNAGTNKKHLILGNYDGMFAIGTSSDSNLTSTSTFFSADPSQSLAFLIGTTTIQETAVFEAIGASDGSATKGTCFRGKQTAANAYLYWYLNNTGPVYSTISCSGTGTTTVIFQ